MAEPSPADNSGPHDSRPSGDGTHDGHLIQKAGRGDHGAMATLAARYEPLLLGLAQGLLRGREDLARDAVQDVWIRVLRSGSAFSGGSSAKTWLYRVTINRCHDVRAKADRTVPRDSARAPGVRPFDAEQSSAVARAVEALKPDQRMLVILCYHSGMTHTQAADILGVPVGTIKSRLHTALNDLRRSLADTGAPAASPGGGAHAARPGAALAVPASSQPTRTPHPGAADARTA